MSETRSLNHRLTGMTAARDERRGSEEPVALLARNTSNFSSTSNNGKAPGESAAGGGLIKTLSWHHLVGVTFFAVCGGDYGIEDSIGAGGVAFTLIGLCVLPWVWSLPIALMTAELSSMIPEAGGYVVWAHRAFGSFWATQNAVWNLVRPRESPPSPGRHPVRGVLFWPAGVAAVPSSGAPPFTASVL
jgi:amino acid transporter